MIAKHNYNWRKKTYQILKTLKKKKQSKTKKNNSSSSWQLNWINPRRPGLCPRQSPVLTFFALHIWNKDSGSGGQISWDQNSTFSWDRQIDHEVKIPNNKSISLSRHFSWDRNCLIMLYFEFRSHDQFVSHKNNHEIKIQKAVLAILISWSIC